MSAGTPDITHDHHRPPAPDASHHDHGKLPIVNTPATGSARVRSFIRRGWPGTTVRAVRWTGRNAETVAALATGGYTRHRWTRRLDLHYDDGIVPVPYGWWVIARPAGEIEIADHRAFVAVFEPAPAPTGQPAGAHRPA